MSVFFNLLLNHYGHMHDTGVINERALVLLETSIREANDCLHHEMGCKSIADFLDLSNKPVGPSTSLLKEEEARANEIVDEVGAAFGATLSIHTMVSKTLEPLVLQYLILREVYCKPTFFEFIARGRLRKVGYRD